MTAANSCIVLTEGLPPTNIAGELLQQLPSYAPTLLNYLDQCQSSFTTVDLNLHRCTALEHWQLQQAGFNASTAKHNAALALLLAQQQQKPLPADSTQPFWLVELVHMAPSRDGAALIQSKDLAISAAQSTALLQSAQNLCEGTPFTLAPWSDDHWLLTMTPSTELPATFASSSLVSRTSVNDWWDQDPRSRDWRRFVNEIQMLYFNHPANTERQQQGLLAINSLWPVGGLSPNSWQATNTTTHYFNQLSAAYLQQDWGQWLLDLQQIDQQLPALLEPRPTLILSNTDHYLSARIQPRRFWQRFFTSTPTWRNHWLAQS